MSPSPFRSAPAPRRRGFLLLALPLALAALSAAPASRSAFPDDAAPAATAAPRLAAVEQEIHHLERRLSSLRKVRVELNAGRPEPAATDESARRVEAADQRMLRELARYASARSKALSRVSEAVSAGDAAKTKEARAALDAADEQFLASIQKIDDARAAAAGGEAAVPAKPAKVEKSPRRSPSKKAPKSTPRESGKGDGMPEPTDSDDDAEDADDDESDDPED